MNLNIVGTVDRIQYLSPTGSNIRERLDLMISGGGRQLEEVIDGAQSDELV